MHPWRVLVGPLLLSSCAVPRRVELQRDGSITLNDRRAALSEVKLHVAGAVRPRIEIHPDTAWRLAKPVLAACLDARATPVMLVGVRVDLHRELDTEMLVLEVEIDSGPRYKLGTLRTEDLSELESWLLEQRLRARYYAHPAVGAVQAQSETPFEVVREVVLAIHAAGIEWISLRVG